MTDDDRTGAGDRDPGRGADLRPGPSLTNRCPAKLARCCGEGILRCDRAAGHPDVHSALEWPGTLTEWS